jgi:hypothetical protein
MHEKYELLDCTTLARLDDPRSAGKHYRSKEYRETILSGLQWIASANS